MAQEVVDKIVGDIKAEMTGRSVERSKETSSLVMEKLRGAITDVFAKAGDVDVVKLIKEKKGREPEEPFVILFLGINGTGKTTTVAKFAYFLKGQGFSVVVAAGDTHRAGAIEQLTEHANRISVKVIAQRYGADPAAVARDGVLYSESTSCRRPPRRFCGAYADKQESHGGDGENRKGGASRLQNLHR